MAPSATAPRSGSGRPPAASTSVKPVTGAAPAAWLPVTVNVTVVTGSASPVPPAPVYARAVSV